MDNAIEGYKPGDEFEEETNDPLLDISLAESTELWLIQWPAKQLKPSDFHGKEVKLKLHRDRKLGSLETSSGKSFEMVSFAAQEPDATVFLPTSSESKIVGKISRRVCLRHFPEPDEFEQPSLANLNPRSQLGSSKSSAHRSTVLRGTDGTSRDTFAYVHSTEDRGPEIQQSSRKNRREENRSSSRGSRPDSHVTDGSFRSEKSHGDKSEKKKKKKKNALNEE